MNIMWMARENYEDLKKFKERNRIRIPMNSCMARLNEL